MANNRATKRLAICAMLSALGVVFLWMGALIEVVDLSVAVLASLLCVFAVIEFGGSAPWLVFAVTAVLSLILLPNKSAAAAYAIFFGYYPIVKEKLEKLPAFFAWLWKEVIFHVALVLLWLAWQFLLFPGETVLPGGRLWLIAALLLAEAVFLLYDVALTRLISFYLVRLRHRLRLK